MMNAPVTGVLLAGGQSRRMGGGDKGLLQLDGKSMLQHAIERLAPQVSALVLNANGDPGRFAGLGLPVVADPIAGYVGPLAGVLAGMRWSLAHAPEHPFIVTAAGDAPLLPRNLVARIALAGSNGALHPVIGLWPVALSADLGEQLRGGVRKVLDWTQRHGSVGVDFANERIDGREIDPFFNANTPQEFEQLRDLLASSRA
jgi:molybdenum cofactor guanylyltransferase